MNSVDFNHVCSRRFLKIAKSDLYLHHMCLCSSVRMGRDEFFMKFDIWVFFENLSRKFQVSLRPGKNYGYFKSNFCTFVIKSRSIRLRMKSASDKATEKTKTHVSCFNSFPPPPSEKRAVHEIMCKIMVEPDCPQVTL
jgi:hypothetical protein